MELRQKILNQIKFKSSNISKYFKQTILISTSILAGICLFLLAAIVFINMTFLNQDFQKKILQKIDAYMQIDYIAKDAIGALTQSLPVENELKNMLNDSYMDIEHKLIKEGVDSLVDGLLEYVKGETKLLPDIYIGNQFLTTPPTEIDKINLGSILLYFNRSYLVDVLMVIRQVFQLLKPVPLIICFFILLLVCSGSIIALNKRYIIIWWKLFFLSSGIMGVIVTFIIFLYSNNFLKYPDIINVLLPSLGEMTLNIFTSYLDKFLHYLLYSTIIYAAFLILISLILSTISNGRYLFLNNTATIYKRPLLMIISLLTVFLMQNLYYLKESYDLNNPATALNRILNYGSISEVIAAIDDTIYSLELKINDDQTGKPISDIKVHVIEVLVSDINSINANSNIDINTVINDNIDIYTDVDTDSNGTANIILNKGLFKLELSSIKDEYILPEPFLVDIKLAGKNTVFLSVSSNKN